MTDTDLIERLREALETAVREMKIVRGHVCPPLQPSMAENLDDAIDLGIAAVRTRQSETPDLQDSDDAT